MNYYEYNVKKTSLILKSVGTVLLSLPLSLVSVQLRGFLHRSEVSQCLEAGTF